MDRCVLGWGRSCMLKNGILCAHYSSYKARGGVLNSPSEGQWIMHYVDTLGTYPCPVHNPPWLLLQRTAPLHCMWGGSVQALSMGSPQLSPPISAVDTAWTWFSLGTQVSGKSSLVGTWGLLFCVLPLGKGKERIASDSDTSWKKNPEKPRVGTLLLIISCSWLFFLNWSNVH